MNPVWWNEVAPGWGMFLAEVALKSALLIAGLLLADRLLGDRRASWRNLLWHAALAGLILVPLAVAWGPSLRVPVPAKAETIVPRMPQVPAAPVVAAKAAASLPVNVPVSEPAAAVADALAEPQAPAWQWPAMLVLAYGAGVFLFLGRLGMGLLYVASLRRQVREVRDERLWPALEEFRVRLGIRRLVRLGTSEQVGSPLQVGVFSPMAILPARLLGRLDEQAFRAVAAHELAHVRRWDYLVHLLALVVLAGHWFNPLAWLALRRLHETGEHACDEWAVRLLGRYEVYAGALLDVLGEMRGQRVRWGLGMAYQAERRLERILAMKNALPAGVSRWVGGVMVLGLSAGAVMLGCSGLGTTDSVRVPADDGPARVSSFIPAFTQGATAPFPEDFLGIPWGSSMAVARVAMLKTGAQELIWDGEAPPDWLEFFEVPYGDNIASYITLHFFDNRLCSAAVVFHPDEKAVTIAFQHWLEILTAQYGQPFLAEWDSAIGDSTAVVLAAFHRRSLNQPDERSAQWWFPAGQNGPNSVHLTLGGSTPWVGINYFVGTLWEKYRALSKSRKWKPDGYRGHLPAKPAP